MAYYLCFSDIIYHYTTAKGEHINPWIRQYRRVPALRMWWEWAKDAAKSIWKWHKISPCTFHHCGWRFWLWMPTWVHCNEHQEGKYVTDGYLIDLRDAVKQPDGTFIDYID